MKKVIFVTFTVLALLTCARAAQINLQTYHGWWVSAAGGGGQAVMGNGGGAGSWETFNLIDTNGGNLESGDEITIQAPNGQYFCAEGGGGQNVVANRTAVGGWEVFRIYNTGGGTIQNGSQVYIRASNNQYFCAEDGGGGVINANRDDPAGWETFTITISGGGGGSGTPQVSGPPSATSIQVGQTITFTVSATCDTGLNELGLEKCNASGTATDNFGFVGVGGTSASHTFSWTATSNGTFYFDTYAWNADRTQLTRTPFVTVTVSTAPESTWIDVNGDGIKDEIIASNSPRFRYSIYSWSTEFSDYWGYNPNDFWFTSTFSNFWSWPWWTGGSDQNIWSLFSWNASWYYYPSYSYTVTYSDLNFSMDVETGYDYRIYSGNQGNPSTWSTVPGLSGDLNFPSGGSQSIYISGLNQDSLFSVNFFFVKLSKPVSSLSVKDSSGNVIAPDTGTDGDASVSAPPDGQVVLNAVDLAGNAVSTIGHQVHWTVFDIFGNLVKDVFGDNVSFNLLSWGELVVLAAVDAGPPKQFTVNQAKLKQYNFPSANGGVEEKEIPVNGEAFITPEPAMPDLEITVNPPVGAMSVSWRMVVAQERTLRNNRDNFTIPSDPNQSINLTVGTPWRITNNYPAIFFGGNCTIHYQYKNAQGANFGPDHTYVFKIHGKNPSDAVAKAYIQSVDHGDGYNYWFLWAIVQHESRGGTSGNQVYNQFVPTGRLAGMPDWGNPDGWGLGHVEHTNTHATYNWKANIDAAVVVLQQKQIISNTFFNGVSRRYGSGEASSPPANFVPPGTQTNISARDSFILTAYNGLQGTLSMVVTNVNGQAQTLQSPWIYTQSSPAGQRWSFHENSNSYVRTVLHNEYEGGFPIESP